MRSRSMGGVATGRRVKFGEREKFAVLACEHAPINPDAPLCATLPDGTEVYTGLPFRFPAHWRKWIGTLRADALHQAKLVLVRRTPSDNPEILDHVHQGLSDYLVQVLCCLQLSGAFHTGWVDVLTGSVLQGKPDIRHLQVLPRFYETPQSQRATVDLARLKQAARLRSSVPKVFSGTGRFRLLAYGFHVLTTGLRQWALRDRIHQFVRSLEALILPDRGSTEKQFVHRCQTFAKAGKDSRRILQDGYRMRSDSEHLHVWDRALQEYPEVERETIAITRTRQMERLACFAYLHILDNPDIRLHFQEGAQGEFWTLPDHQRRIIWGRQFELTPARPLAPAKGTSEQTDQDRL